MRKRSWIVYDGWCPFFLKIVDLQIGGLAVVSFCRQFDPEGCVAQFSPFELVCKPSLKGVGIGYGLAV